MSFNWNNFFSGLKNGATRLNRLQGVRRYSSLSVCVENRQNIDARPVLSGRKTRAVMYNVKNKCAYKDYCAAAAASSSAAHGSLDGAGASTSLRARASAACCRQSVVKMIPSSTATRRA